ARRVSHTPYTLLLTFARSNSAKTVDGTVWSATECDGSRLRAGRPHVRRAVGPPTRRSTLRRVRPEVLCGHDPTLRRHALHFLHPEVQVRHVAVDAAEILRALGPRGLEVVPVCGQDD